MNKLTLVAVDVRSTHNIGSLFRSCDGFGAELALVGICPYPKQSDDERLPYIAERADKQIAKTALGAEKTVRWRRFESIEDCLGVLRSEGYVIAAIEQAPHSKSITALPIDPPLALVVGREVEGLNQDELKLCDDVFEIPMQGIKESFNVSVAAGIGLYQASLLR